MGPDFDGLFLKSLLYQQVADRPIFEWFSLFFPEVLFFCFLREVVGFEG